MTNYYVCSTTGSNSNPGTETAPFKTIQYIAEKAQPGDTINVFPGIYRERVSPSFQGERQQPITYKSIEKHGAIVRGSIAWNYETLENNIASGPIDDTLFSDHSHLDGHNPFHIPLTVTPQKREGFPETKIDEIKNSDPNMIYCLGQVFVDDEMFLQTPYKTEMESTNKSWFYDTSSNVLYINGVIEGQTVEITNQRRLFAPHKRNLRNIIVDGFIFERCANQYPNKFWSNKHNQQAGAFGTRCGKYWIIKNNIIRYANCVGIDWGNEGNLNQDLEHGDNGEANGSYGHQIIDNIICDNGAAGTAAYMANAFTFNKNIVERNNNLHFYGKQRWESGGVKVHRPKKSTFNHNIIRNNYCHGLWSDQGAGVDTTYSNNIFHSNSRSGLEFEIGYDMDAKVINNVFDDNDCGIRFSTSGGVLISNNIFIKSKTYDIYTHFFNRGDKWDSLNLNIFYNLFCHSPQYFKLTQNSEDPPSQRALGQNTYMVDDDTKFQVTYDKHNKPFFNYDSWKDIFGEDSVVLETPGEAHLDCSGNTYTLHLSMSNTPLLSKNEKMGSDKDFFGNLWGEYCCSGPVIPSESKSYCLC